jgi:hypothetical protein
MSRKLRYGIRNCMKVRGLVAVKREWENGETFLFVLSLSGRSQGEACDVAPFSRFECL